MYVVVVLFLRGVHHPEFPSVLTALEIDDPVVANCLIDVRGIEKILLIKVRLFPPYWPLKKGSISLYSIYPVPPLFFVCDRQVEVWWLFVFVFFFFFSIPRSITYRHTEMKSMMALKTITATIICVTMQSIHRCLSTEGFPVKPLLIFNKLSVFHLEHHFFIMGET